MGASSSKERCQAFINNDYHTLLQPLNTRCDAPPVAPPLPPPGECAGASTTGTAPQKAAAPPPPPPESDSIEQAAASVSSVTNPGPYEHVSMDAKRLVSLDTYDGARVDINKQLSPFMLVVHSFWLGTTMLPDGRNKTYSFVAQVADENQGFMMARVDPERGSVDGRIHKALLGGLAMAKLQVGVSSEGANDSLVADLDFGGNSWTGNAKYGSMMGGNIFGCNYLQAITPKFTMGGEGVYVPANQSMVSSYTLKYSIPAKTGDESVDSKVLSGEETKETGGSSTVIANYHTGQGALTLNYKRVVTPERVTLGAEYQFSPMSLESSVLVGGEFKLQRSKMCLCVDGNGKIQSTLETKIGMAQGSPTLNFAGEVDHWNNVMRFGYGLNIEG